MTEAVIARQAGVADIAGKGRVTTFLQKGRLTQGGLKKMGAVVCEAFQCQGVLQSLVCIFCLQGQP